MITGVPAGRAYDDVPLLPPEECCTL